MAMKVKVLSRVEADYARERKGGLDRVMRNPDPALHPLEKAREVRVWGGKVRPSSG